MDLCKKSVTILQEQVYWPGKSVMLNDNVLILILSLHGFNHILYQCNDNITIITLPLKNYRIELQVLRFTLITYKNYSKDFLFYIYIFKSETNR